MTMTNLIFVGKTLISYAVDDVSTNVKNIEFGVSLEDSNLILKIGVKQDGYFNGQIEIGKANFKIKESATTSEYINKIEGNTITLNQINAGSSAEIQVPVELLRDELFDLSLLNMESEVTLKGTYKNSSEKDISVASTKKVQLTYPSANIEKENILSQAEIITNKEMTINGEKRRVVQLALQLGLKDNSYPIKSISLENIAPKTSDSSYPDVSQIVNLNTMTYWKSNTSYEKDAKTTIEMTNAENDGKIVWKKQGNEEIILTYIAKTGITIESQDINITGKIKLYDDVEIEINSIVAFNAAEEKDTTISVDILNAETEMYKGKLYNGIDREISTKTTVNVNLENVHESLEIKEENVFATQEEDLNNEKAVSANILYKNTILNKEQWLEALGENGVITVLNKDGETITTIDKNTEANEQGNIEISYENGQEGITIKTTAPAKTGKLTLTHNKILKNNTNLELSTFTKFATKVAGSISIIELKEPKTEAKLDIDKESLSTVIKNSVQMKAVLKTNNEQYELYKNPTITITLPEDIETIELAKVEMSYEKEMKIKEYKVEGRVITIVLEGEQTNYAESSIEGATILIDANITVNRKSATKDAKVKMLYTNQKSAQQIQEITNSIKIIAPTEITAVYNIDTLGISTIGQEETKTVKLPLSSDTKQIDAYIEIINNKAVAIQNVQVLGVLPTASTTNTIKTTMLEGIKLQGIENVKIYYTENENATQDLENSENGWIEKIEDLSKAKKYLIVINEIAPQSSIIATYKAQIPAELEYNQEAKQWYEIEYTDSQTNTQNKMKSTVIETTTGVGPIMEVSLTGKVGAEQLSNGSTVKAGEVIKYQIEVSNTGTEEVKNAKITAPIPEGTTYVQAKENYEYTGSVYYQEVKMEKCEDIIESINPGEKIIKQYEVRVNKDIETGKEIKNTVELNYGEVTKKTNELKYIGEAGNIRISVKRITDRNTSLYTGGVVQYFAMIENISDKAKNNVTVETNISNGLSVEELTLMTGLKEEDVSDNQIHTSSEITEDIVEVEITEEELLQNELTDSEIKSEVIEYSNSISIGELQPGEVKVLSYDMSISEDTTDVSNIQFSAIAKELNATYKSNEWTDTVNKFDIAIELASNKQDKYVKAGDILEYTITVKNNSDARTNGLTIEDAISKSLTITKITINGEEEEIPSDNILELSEEIEASNEAIIKIETLVDYKENRQEAETISNKVEARIYGETVATSTELTHIIEPNTEGGDNSEENNNNIPDNNVATGSKIISGMAWVDENGNGKKEDSENTLNGIVVKLLNVETNKLVKDSNGNILQATTDDKGIYTLNHIGNGKYVVIFEYDTAQYTLTKYQVEGVVQSDNSNAIMSELSIEEERKTVTTTDIIEIQNTNISDINIGLIKLQNFDLKLDKYITKIIIQNAEGTTVKEYTDETLAKIELDGKTINGTMAIIEYKIKITNNGEVPGYVKKVVDYAPSELKFNSELNKDWYQSGTALYNTSLANTKIAAGEEKELTLTLTKTLTEDNIGRVNNTAEIVESYNELGLPDSNSTVDNKTQGENDTGVADTIISVKTGGAVLYTSIIGMTIVILGITIIFLQNRRMKKSKNTRKLDKIS